MRLTVDCDPGELSAHPDRAMGALAALAERDGADREDWIEKALRSGGARSRAIEVDTTPRHRAIQAEIERADAVYAEIMLAMIGAVTARLRAAAEDADLGDLVEQIR